MNDILVSIIIPVYNGEKYLKEAINSALSQTYENIEIIVVNDGSTDKTEKIALAYGKKIRYFNKKNGGVSTALNLGIEKMTGQYFSWLSHDDVYYPNKIEEQLKFLYSNYNEKTILYTDYEIINSKSEHVTNVVLDHEELINKPEYGLLRCKINGISLLIPKIAFENVGLFNMNLRCTQDYEKWYEMIKAEYNFVHFPKILVKTRVHDEQVTNTSPRVQLEGDELWIKLIDYPTNNTKKRLEGSEYLYYLKTFEFLNLTPYKNAAIYCEKKLKELEPKNNLMTKIYRLYKEIGMKELLKRVYNKYKKNNKSISELGNLENQIFELNNKINVLEQKIHQTTNDISKQSEQTISTFLKLNERVSLKLFENINYLTIYHYEENLKKFESNNKFNPLVSIVIPVYNGTNYMKEAIDSALNQSYKNVEVIVVNDGSNDGGKSEKIALSYGNKIKYLKKDNGGVSSALNFGIQHMQGEYFAWLSHDDKFKNNHIEKHIEYIRKHQGVKIVTYTNLEIIDSKGNLIYDLTMQFGLFGFNYFLSLSKSEYALFMGEINGDSILIPKEAFTEIGLFDENQRITQERDMWFRLMESYKFVLIPYVTTSLRIHDSQVSVTAKDVVEKSNTKQKELINSISHKKIMELEDNEIDFYIKLKKHYDLNGRQELAEFMNIKIKENIKGKIEANHEK